VPDSRDAKLLQVLSRQARKNRFVNLILAERSLILSKAKAPQPDHDVHDEAQASPRSISSCERHGEGPQRRRGWEGERKQALRRARPLVAERFRRIIREQFVKMYEDHDVLQEVLDWARKDLAENAKGLLGKPPKNGSLNVKEVLEAEYAFA
jgi:hypothetical protein